MPEGCVQTVVTSPPYWSLRNYGIDGQIGLEDSVYAFIDALAELFEEVWRVLRDDGTMWLNIGDSYTSGGRTWRAPSRRSISCGGTSALSDKRQILDPWIRRINTS
ncbi:DNA methyltransferase [Candidatus Mycobacterium methanotrophicum]|uniref:site-specific DNA-methyltransferase (cytosine-N(4)-specific) n=1 Tax=Candidatus Mycobacterium methanotrophicum TaxID=2943498 RepID=A0ABY4QLK8_9MYCO|nr:DNA methyltransferase [Candidatus Mycobacterium methanotrophicum]UQX10845.1 site-specific DNA-methyltransferase [Candidatus Mycobacterium methanotrophicum]